MSRLKSKRSIALVMLLAVGLTAAAGAAVLANRVEEVPPPDLTVHEWGTFTTFAGSDGKLLRFRPDNDDLPAFVHRSPRGGKFNVGGVAYGGGPGSLVTMETPVLYFYSDRELTASVDVVFPLGQMTEWYPRQTPNNAASWLRYENLRIIPNGTTPLPTDPPPGAGATQTMPLDTPKPPSHYYAARETDANLVQVEWDEVAPAATPSWLGTVRDKLGWKDRPVRHVETEKFIFYRGTADMSVPVQVTALGDGKVRIQNTATRGALLGCVLMQVQNGVLRFVVVGRVGDDAQTVALPTEPASREALGETLVYSLTKAGLHEKEARAMVKTWDSAWFGEEGTRLLYLVPQPFTDEVLPLRISPQPTSTVRVLVGRHDFLTPEREREIAQLVKTSQNGQLPEAERDAATLQIQKLGRFADPARRISRLRLNAVTAAQ